MIFDYSIIKAANAVYEERRREAQSRPERLKNLLLSDKTYVATLNSLNAARLEKSKALFSDDEKTLLNAEKIIAQKNKELKKIKRALGVSDEDLSPRYACKECSDTGYLSENKRCACFYKLVGELAFSSLGLEKKDLSSFGKSDYRDKNGLGKLFDKFDVYCDKFGKNSKNVVISGGVGSGKSYLAKRAANKIEQTGFNVVALSAIELDSIFLKCHIAPPLEKNSYLNVLSSCDLLVVDDLGSEPIYKNVTEEYLLCVISERIEKGAPFIVTTNLNQTQLLDRYGDRIFSRLNDKRAGVNIELDGEDLRRIKSK